MKYILLFFSLLFLISCKPCLISAGCLKREIYKPKPGEKLQWMDISWSSFNPFLPDYNHWNFYCYGESDEKNIKTPENSSFKPFLFRIYNSSNSQILYEEKIYASSNPSEEGVILPYYEGGVIKYSSIDSKTKKGFKESNGFKIPTQDELERNPAQRFGKCYFTGGLF